MVATSLKHDGRYKPNPYRTGIASAIMLEKAWDAMAGYGPARPTPFDRILPQGAKRERKFRLNLPKRLDDVALRKLSDERVAAIEELHRQLAETMNLSERRDIDVVLEESLNRRDAVQYHVVARRRHVNGVEDGRDIDLDVAAALAAEADKPQIAKAEPRNDNARIAGIAPSESDSLGRDSIAIDLVLHSIIVAEGVDREALHRELTAIRRALPNRLTERTLHSPRSRSNTGLTLESLGPSFPPAALKLIGMSLEAKRIDLDPVYPHGAGWTYEATLGKMSMTTSHRPRSMDLWDAPGRTLAVLTGDPTWHPNLVVDRASGPETSNGAARLTFFATRTHIDPPGSPAPTIHATLESSQAAPLDQRRTARWRHLDAVPVVRASLDRAGSRLTHEIVLKEGVGLQIRTLPRTNMDVLHTHDVKADTIADGVWAIDARVVEILTKIAKFKPRATRAAKLAMMNANDQNISKATGRRRSKIERPLTPSDPITMFGADDAERMKGCAVIDALLASILADNAIDTGATLHFQEGMACIATASLGDGMTYRLEKFDRTLGKPTHAVGVVEVDRSLTPSIVERLRDGSIGIIVQPWPMFGASQVRKVSRDDISTLVTVRVPLLTRQT